LGTNRESPRPLGKGWEGVPLNLTRIEILPRKGISKLRGWWRGNYLKKILKEIEDHPYTMFNHKQEGGDPRKYIISGDQATLQ